jgi:hypothetical protein
VSLPPYKISTKYTDRFKSCAHLRNLNVRHFEIFEATGLKKCDVEVILNGSTCLPKFHENPYRFKSSLVGGTDRLTDIHSHTQAGDLISPLSFYESRLTKWVDENIL